MRSCPRKNKRNPNERDGRNVRMEKFEYKVVTCDPTGFFDGNVQVRFAN